MLFRSERAVREIVAKHGAKGILVVAGFCGGLSSQVSIGDIVLVERARTPLSLPNEIIADSLLLKAVESVPQDAVKLHKGRMVSVPKVLVRVEEKSLCRQQTDAIAVDMETFGAVRVAEELGLRWIALRVVTDAYDEPLPLDFNAFADAEGNPSRAKIALAVLTKPFLIPKLIRLGGASASGAKRLQKALIPLMRTLSEL